MKTNIYTDQECREVLERILNNLETNQIESGDVVQLKSGGPLMTTGKSEMKDEMKYISCVWFDDNKNIQSQKLNIDLLKLV
jgi:uncharacterized protein YodC (DUF2158 family)